MVTITGYKMRATHNGDKSIYLIVEGGMQPAVSKSTGRTYFKSRKASVFAAIDEEVAKSMVGYQIPGTIKQLRVEPYQITNEQTGEVMMYDYRNEFVAEEQLH
jgi:hypothetical protein